MRSLVTSKRMLSTKVSIFFQYASLQTDLTMLPDTAWYNIWAVDNAKHRKSTIEQISKGLMRCVTLSNH